jgi:hypothetical protein
MNKQVKYTYDGVNQDLSKSKHPFQFYYEGQHIKIISTDTQATGSVANEKGNELVITLPTIRIIGQQNIAVQAVNNLGTVLLGENITIAILNNDIFLYPVTVSIITAPTKGNVVINNNNSITYTNTDSIVGTDSIVYQINDGETTSNATVTINVQEAIVIPIEDIEVIENNYDGNFYYYKFAPCDRTLSFINVKTNTQINDFDDVYTILGSQGIGKDGKIIYKISPISTTWTLGFITGNLCSEVIGYY